MNKMTANSEKIKNLLEKIHAGLDLEEAKKIFQEELGSVSASELAQAENSLIEAGMPIEELQNLCDVHASVVDKSVEDIHNELEKSHPLHLFHLENKAFENHIKHNLQVSAQKYFKNPEDKSRKFLLQDLKKLKALFLHYDRKENLIFPFLEEKSITSIPQVMWGVDDEIRQSLKDIFVLVEKSDHSEEDLKKIQGSLPNFVSQVKSMISKEEDILSPLLKENLDLSHWLQIAKESKIYPIQMLDSNPYAQIKEQEKWIEENESKLSQLEDKKEDRVVQVGAAKSNLSFTLHFPTGTLNLEELESIFSTFPMEVTFTDKEDKVRYFSQHDKMVFPRPLSSLGRDVMLCHPPKAQPVVRQLLNDFRTGAKDQEVRWLKKGNNLLLIRYLAVRDYEKNYIGCLELVEDLKAIPGIEDFFS